MAKINRTIKFFISIGIIIYIDTVIDITSFFNMLIQVIVFIILGLKIENIGIYTSLYASIAVLLSSNITIIEKLEYSIGLFILYIAIFTFITVYDILHPSYSLYLTLIVFITMTFPILLWIILDNKYIDKRSLDIDKRSDKTKRRKVKTKI